MGKQEGKKIIAKSRRRWENNIKIDFKRNEIVLR
jgi:hypothetical protein